MGASLRVKIAFALIVYVILEASLAVGLVALKKVRNIPSEPAYSFKIGPNDRKALEKIISGDTQYFRHDRNLGWSIKPGARSTYKGPLYAANRAGLRGSREYAPKKPRGVVRLAAFGDSFTHGDDVENSATFEEQLEKLDGRLEVLNFGVPGYGTDQALLRYERDALAYEPDVVILGFYPDDANRLVSAYRPFIYPEGSMPLAKPRFVLNTGGEGLTLLENPITDAAMYQRLLDGDAELFGHLGQHDFYYQGSYRRRATDMLPSLKTLGIALHQLNKRRSGARSPVGAQGLVGGSEGIQILERIYARFAYVARARGSLPVALLLPGRPELDAYLSTGRNIFDPLLKTLEKRKIAAIDMNAGFKALAPGEESQALMPDHYSRRGNAIVARYLHQELRRLGLVP